MLAEQAGHAVQVVEGDPRNLKITTPADLAVAERLLGLSSPAARSCESATDTTCIVWCRAGR